MRKNSWESHLFHRRFWSKVEKTEGCWWWRGGKMNGYGRIRMNMARVSAHRAAWRLTYGKIPLGLCVLHRCDNPLCVNPVHLFLGTQADNLADMHQKGRGRSGSGPGEINGNSKLTCAQVRRLRLVWNHLPRGGKSRLAKDLGITHTHAIRIANGENWR